LIPFPNLSKLSNIGKKDSTLSNETQWSTGSPRESTSLGFCPPEANATDDGNLFRIIALGFGDKVNE